MLPQTKSLQDLQLQLLNIVRCDPKVIPREVVLDHLVGILQDIISLAGLKQINNRPTSRIPKYKILGDMFRIIKALHSLSINLSDMSSINKILEDTLSQVLNKFLMESNNETLKHLILTQLMDESKMEPENEYFLDLQLRIISISQMDPVKIPIDVILDAFSGIFNHMVSSQWNGSYMSLRKEIIHIDHQAQYILEMKRDMMSVLLNVSLLGEAMNEMQSQDMTESSADLLVEVPEKLQSFAEMDAEALADNLTSECLSEIEILIEQYVNQLKSKFPRVDSSTASLLKVMALKVTITLYKYPGKGSSLHKYLSSLLTYPVNEVLNEVVSDPVSGMPDDLLSLIVYIFFPPLHLHPHTASTKSISNYFYKKQGKEIIWTGSNLENLLLPTIEKRSSGNISEQVYSSLIMPDCDAMFDLGIFSDIYDSMSIEIDKNWPVFCKIKHGMPLNYIPENRILGENLFGVVIDQYLSSAVMNVLFRLLRKNNEKRRLPKKNGPFLDEMDFIFKTDYNSPALVATMNANDNSAIPFIPRSNDGIFCIPVKWDEEYKQDFLRRLKPNKWPKNCIANLEKLLTERVYAIPKPDPDDTETGHLRWRLSFSVIELELAQTLTEIQRRCYKVLKALIKFDVNEGLQEDRKFPSYYLKTAMFWFCEETGDSWKIENLGMQWLKLLDSVIECLEKKELLMYFIPGYNLLSGKVPGLLVWIGRLKEIRKHPLKSFDKFWSKYEVVATSKLSQWGRGYSTFLEKLCMIYGFTAYIKRNTSNHHQKLQYCNMYNSEAQICKVYLRYATAVNHLATNCLVNFLKLVNFFPQTKELIFFANSQSKEHLIWKFYSQIISNGLVCQSKHECGTDKYCYNVYYMYLAEVTHHMVIKYGDQVPDKDLFSIQTAEKFHLIACSFQNEEVDSSMEKYIRYANYLHAEKQLEDAVQLLNVYHNIRTTRDEYGMNRVTSEVYDACLKLHLAFENEIICDEGLTVYHLLTSCYIQAGVLAEVYIPEHFQGFSDIHIGVMPICESSVEKKKVLLGFQYILCGRLVEALQTCGETDFDYEYIFADIPFQKLRYAAMLYITSMLYSEFHDSSISHSTRKDKILRLS